jgi:hypothetical protein
VARVCQDFLSQNHIRVLPLSLGLSPIEHLWDELYQSTKETIQGFDAQYFLHREKKIDKYRII